MAKLWGMEWTREEIEQRVGDVLQIGGVRLIELADGKERGVRAAQFRTGSGLSFTVLLDRGLDISHADWSGRAMNWRSMTEDAHPHFHEPTGEPGSLGWVRTFFGGLMTTCGLNWSGAPCYDEQAGPTRLGARQLGLHGYISHTPAKNVYADGEWDGDEYRMWVRGKCQEGLVFGENLILHREISTSLGSNAIRVRDRVENAGYDRPEHMILYHLNVGFPAVDGNSEVLTPSRSITARDEAAEQGKDTAHLLDPPTEGYHEKAYFHDMNAGLDGMTGAAVVNRRLGFGVYCKYRVDQLPYFCQWKMMGQRDYVVGMEPCNALPLGRVAERDGGRLQYLEPRESREYELEVGALTSADEIAAFEAQVKAWRG